MVTVVERSGLGNLARAPGNTVAATPFLADQSRGDVILS
jgi:hypothetical protein